MQFDSPATSPPPSDCSISVTVRSYHLGWAISDSMIDRGVVAAATDPAAGMCSATDGMAADAALSDPAPDSSASVDGPAEDAIGAGDSPASGTAERPVFWSSGDPATVDDRTSDGRPAAGSSDALSMGT